MNHLTQSRRNRSITVQATKSILEPVQFQYKGTAEAIAAIRAKAATDPRVQALAASIELGKEITK